MSIYATAALIVALFVAYVWLLFGETPQPVAVTPRTKPKPVFVLDFADADESCADEFTARILNLLNAVEQDPTLLDDLDPGRLGDQTETDMAELAAIEREMGEQA